MLYHRHIIRNFPKNYPFWKKILANIIFFFGATIIHRRDNLLTEDDLKNAKNKIKKGDIVLVGGLRRLSSFVIRGPVTHSLFYVGGNNLIHSIADGVTTVHLHDLFCEYDTILILRHKTINKIQLNSIIDYLFLKLGKPYDFEFDLKNNSFYCSELIYHAFKSVGVDLFPSTKKTVIHPKDFVNKDFEVVFTSHNLKVNKNNTVSLLPS